MNSGLSSLFGLSSSPMSVRFRLSPPKRLEIKLLKLFVPLLTLHLSFLLGFALTDQEIRGIQISLTDRPVGERIAFWAERFVGTPYDTDPLGEYVSKETIVADERVDCMYLTFRAVELALGDTPEAAIHMALEKRFHSQGVLRNHKVMNYDDRFEYGEDMIYSGKWGKDITAKMGRTSRIEGSRGRDSVDILLSHHLAEGMRHLKSGDILFFIKRPEQRERVRRSHQAPRFPRFSGLPRNP